MCLDTKYAWFAICHESVFNHTSGPFVCINQYDYIDYVVRIPLKFFIQLAANIAPIPADLNIVLLTNIGRCGSTLLSQMFEEMPNTITISGIVVPQYEVKFKNHTKTMFQSQKFWLICHNIRLSIHLTMTRKTSYLKHPSLYYIMQEF